MTAGLFKRPVSLLARHVPGSEVAADYVRSEKRDDTGLRKARRSVKRARQARLGGYYVVKGSDARVAAATGRVPSHVKSPEVYIPQREPLRPPAKRKHRGTRAYRIRLAKRHMARSIAALIASGVR